MGKQEAAAAAAAEEAKELSEEPQAEQKRRGGTAKFKKGSKVLVPHTDQYYAAVVIQGQKRPEGQFYLLHYEGWSNKYNEWVEEAGVVRFDRTLLEQSAAAAGNEPGDLTGRNRRADIAPAEPQLAVEIPQQLRLHIPPLLKKVVLDDSSQININGKLLPLPRNSHGRPTINDILKEYEAQVAKEVPDGKQQDLQIAEAVAEMLRGVRHYFDQGLHHFLLYSHELHQADEAVGSAGDAGSSIAKNGGRVADRPASGSGQPSSSVARSPCDLYGAEHLVRLFVKLPDLVPVAYMTPSDVVRLEQQLHDLMARMTEVRRQARYFSLPEEYQPNPHFNALLALPLQTLLSNPGGGGTSGGTPRPAPTAGGGTPGTVATREAPGGAAAAGTSPNSEAADMDQLKEGTYFDGNLVDICMGRGDAARRRRKNQEKTSLRTKPPASTRPPAGDESMSRSMRKMLQLKAAAAAAKGKGHQPVQQQSNDGKKKPAAAARHGAEPAQQRQQQPGQEQREQNMQQPSSGYAQVFAPKTLKSKKKEFLKKKLKKRGKHAGPEMALSDKEAALAAAAVASAPAFGEQAHQPLKVVLKRKHWLGGGYVEQPTASRRCTEIFQRQMAAAKAAVSAAAPKDGTVQQPRAQPQAQLQPGKKPVKKHRHQQQQKQQPDEEVRMQLIDAYRQQKQTRFGIDFGSATKQSLAALVRKDAGKQTFH